MSFFKKALAVTLFLMLIVLGCAKKGMPTGGPKDADAPKVVMSNPDNKAVNFSEKKFKIYFDEYVKLDDIDKQLVVSPPQKYKPLITPLGGVSKKYITVEIQDTLRPSTTYSFNFGNSIIDATEGNPYKNLTYTFSTGSYIDSLQLGGRIINPLVKGAIKEEVSVFLYEYNESYNDSTVYKEKPRYIASLDSLKNFKFDNIKEGSYKLVAFVDKNQDYYWDPIREKIAFVDEPITLPTAVNPTLKLFKTIPTLKIVRPKLEAANKMLLGYVGDREGLQITLSKGDTIVPHYITKIEDKDSLEIWFKPIVADSLLTTISQGIYKHPYTIRLNKKERDSLRLNFSPSGTLHFRDTVAIEYATPVEKINSSKIGLFYNDSIPVTFKLEHKAFYKRTKVLFKKEPETKYTLRIFPDAIEDYFGETNTDTLRTTFSTKDLTDYGNLTLTLENVKRFPVIVQLTNEKGEVKASEVVSAIRPIVFDALQPAVYNVRIVYDDNKNGKWDTGSFRNKIQPEEIFHFDKSLDVRMNWDVNQPIDLSK
ncbi:MAG: Ig-like domain-containing protein [Flavobacteriales bacterium]|nr:Ig-like domain-containing protein [Flavobacteriales bacterium]